MIKKILGEGGMGAALLAEDTRLDNKPVVIKELISDNTDPARLQEDVRNFKREVSTLVQVDHFLVPSVTDHFQEGSHYFMVQDYVPGENLEDRLERLQKPLEEQDVLTYASDVLLVLDYLEHRKPPIVHRDIKPANIIICTNDGRAHLVDFGIARADVAQNAAKKQTSALGTPGYAPPEQYQGNADGRSDLYALAATMHHLLTNRDPREHAPFVYPSVRSLNPKLSPDIDRVLTRALTSDITKRYQTAAEMKNDIDEILLERFGIGVSVTTGAHPVAKPRTNPSGVHAGGLSQAAATAPAPTTRQGHVPNSPASARPRSAVPSRPATPPPPPPQRQQQYQPIGMYGGQQQVKGPNLLLRFALFALVIIVLAAVVLAAANGLLRGRQSNTGTATPAATATLPPPTAPSLPNGIGAYPVTNSQGKQEYIGISDGSFAFDTSRQSGDGHLKQQAADQLNRQDKNYSAALSYLQQAISMDPKDAEALIYQENIRVLTSGSPYVTLVVGAMLSGDVGVGREILQGAYVAQKEFNDAGGVNGVKLRLLVASSGSEATYATTIANQVVKAAQADKTIVGVMGWPYSSQALNAISPLAAAHIPMVSETASSDLLSGTSPYFFRVAPSNVSQGQAGANYALQTLHARKVALFYDPGDPYSSSLADDFSRPFTAGGGQIVVKEQYKVGQSSDLPGKLQTALQSQPDLIYFSGYAADVSALLQNLPTTGQYANLMVLGGDALYQPAGYASNQPGFTHLRFTTFAYPDTWNYLRQTPPPFYSDYPRIYNPDGQHGGYGYTRAAYNTLLSYDALAALIEGCRRVISGGKQTFTGADLQQALTTISGSRAIQGVSGQISFDNQGNPVNKAILVLVVDNKGHIGIASVQGKFLK